MVIPLLANQDLMPMLIEIGFPLPSLASVAGNQLTSKLQKSSKMRKALQQLLKEFKADIVKVWGDVAIIVSNI